MLSIYYGEYEAENFIFSPSYFFNTTYEDSWFEEEQTKEIVRDIDKSEVIGPNLIDSPFLGPIPPTRLSGRVKTLILIAHDRDHVFNASIGENCAPWLLKIGEQQDILIRQGYLMHFEEPFEIRIANTGEVVHTMRDLALTALDYLE